jgi:hypothetical protein
MPGNTAAVSATKDIVEQLIGTRGDGSSKALLRKDMTSPEFIAQYGNPAGMAVLIPTTKALPDTWKETTFTSPIAGMRYIQKL